MILRRRGFLAGLASSSVAPAIVRIESLMPVRVPLLLVSRIEIVWGGLLISQEWIKYVQDQLNHSENIA